MTPQRAKELLPRVTKNMELLKAISEGKQIQYKTIGGWADYLPNHSNLCFDLTDDPDARRIKPSKTWRPWKPEEVPVGCLLDNGVGWVGILMAVNRKTGQCLVFQGVNPAWESIQEVWSNYTHSLDGGKTWQPCGVEE